MQLQTYLVLLLCKGRCYFVQKLVQDGRVVSVEFVVAMVRWSRNVCAGLPLTNNY